MRRLFRTVLLVGLAAFALVTVAVVSTFRTDLPVDELRARYGTPPSQFVDVAGMPVHVRIEGEGPPLVLGDGCPSLGAD